MMGSSTQGPWLFSTGIGPYAYAVPLICPIDLFKASYGCMPILRRTGHLELGGICKGFTTAMALERVEITGKSMGGVGNTL
uniref:Uncharacterized protein K0122H06.36 n=1 Tax=Oryza sativa subsp. indica TaxID=39946 RepID=C8TFE8_ORYSI|nr:hypothetical protein [Oryza sativa Indica Group]